jgi:hypothetical protein
MKVIPETCRTHLVRYLGFFNTETKILFYYEWREKNSLNVCDVL